MNYFCDTHNIKLVYTWWNELICPYCDEANYIINQEEGN